MGKGIKRYYSIIIAAAVSLISFTLTTCNPTEPICPEPKPPGYQEDIPWPSLADSPWPMNHADPQSTGRSKYIGKQLHTPPHKKSAKNLMNSLAIGLDNNLLYITSVPSILYSINLDEDSLRNWTYNIRSFESTTTPLITSDGKIIFPRDGLSSGIPGIVAVDRSGNFLWEYPLQDKISSIGINIDRAGNIYFVGDDHSLYSINQNGDLNFKFSDDRLLGGVWASPTFSPDGDVIYLQGRNTSVIAFDIGQKEIKWSFGNKRLTCPPMVDAFGNIYIHSNTDSLMQGVSELFSINDEGNINWTYKYKYQPAGLTYNSMDLTLDKNGNIYFAIDTLFSIDYKGILRWKRPLSGIVCSPLICDSQGKIYVATSEGSKNYIYCFDNDGILVGSQIIYDYRSLGFSPIIDKKGTIYWPTIKGEYIYIFN